MFFRVVERCFQNSSIQQFIADFRKLIEYLHDTATTPNRPGGRPRKPQQAALCSGHLFLT